MGGCEWHHIRTEERNGVGFLRQVKSGLGPRYMALRARDRRSLVIRGGSEATARSDSLTRVYENLVLTYLASLLYLYPYGISLGPAASIRVTDVLGLLCVLLGGAALLLRKGVRIDPVFLAVMGPFVFLELATPVIGAVGYRQPLAAVSSLRIAILWIPMILLTMLAAQKTEPRVERKMRLLLATTLCLNVSYALVQIAVDLGYLPDWLAFTRFLEPWAVDRQFEVIEGLRPAGFFVKTTALSVFGIVCLCFFYASYAANRMQADLHLALLSLFLVVLTTSRAGYAAAALILGIGWLSLTGRKKVIVLLALGLAGSAVLLAIDATMGIERMFHRFQRLAESGLLADVSFGQRVTDIWPAALAAASDYPMGTLISAPRIAALIDSGYLNYYLQGKWVFIASITFMLVCQWLIGLRFLRDPLARGGALMILFLASYLTVGMIVTNPLRSPVLIFFATFAFWKLKTERAGLRLILSRGPTL